MALKLNRLNARRIATITKPGRHADGGGLYLYVDASRAKRWRFVFRKDGRKREMGFGGLDTVSLGLARELAAEARKTVALGGDPILRRSTAKMTVPTFGKFADQFLETKNPGWRNAKHRYQWAMSLGQYAASLRAKPLDVINTEDVLEVLKPIWSTKSETASRIRGRIEQVLDAARAAGHRSGENPARWKGHLDQLLPRRRKLARGHHPAMPYGDVPAFMEALRKRTEGAAAALEFLILTATRTGETIYARWSEIDLEVRLWTIPKARMKANRDHRVPLSGRALAILEKAARRRCGTDGDEYVFPGQRRGRPLSNMVFAMLLRRAGVGHVTAHGFRSSFRDWAGDRTHFPREVAEAALAHAVGDETEVAYRRGDALEKRRRLMDAWSEFLEGGKDARVFQISGRRRWRG
jgi:integrase